jgi:hypothetical protein
MNLKEEKQRQTKHTQKHRAHFKVPPYNVKNRSMISKLSLPVFSTFNSANKIGRDLDYAARQRASPPCASE